MGWEFGGNFKLGGTYVFLWLIHVDIWQKPTQYFKAQNFKPKKTVKQNLGSFIRGTQNSYLSHLILVFHHHPLSLGIPFSIIVLCTLCTQVILKFLYLPHPTLHSVSPSDN